MIWLGILIGTSVGSISTLILYSIVLVNKK